LGLEVHHVKLFKDILDETLLELKLDYKDTKSYSKDELSLITNIILGKHLSIDYLTLCKKCHTAIHSENWAKTCTGNQRYYEKQKLIKHMQSKNNIVNILPIYLENIIGKRLFKDKQKELYEKINAIDDRGRLLKSYNYLNAHFNENSLSFSIQPYTDNFKKSEDGSENINYRKVYWIVDRIHKSVL